MFHLNLPFKISLIELIVQQLTNKEPEISKLAIESIEKIYKNDKDLQLSLDVKC